MKKNAFLLLLGVTTLSACMATTQNIQATQATDGNMTCENIQTEMAEMNATIAEVDQKNAQAHATNIGTGVAGHAAGLGGLPYLGAAISHAGGIANMTAGDREALKRSAEMRLNTLNGLYVGKGCANNTAPAAGA